MTELIVTTSRKARANLIQQAQAWAHRLRVTYLPRDDLSLRRLAEEAGVAGALVVTPQRVVYREPSSGLEYFFHPNLARLRIHNLKTGRGDPMVTAMALAEGDWVLDCTLGRGTDAIIAAWVVSESGEVVGVEKVPVIAQLTIHGLQTYEEHSAELKTAMRRVKALEADYEDFLPQQAGESFDVVYFDPIFDQPVDTSAAIRPLRHLAADEPVTQAALVEARRVARRRVVVKQRRDTPLWAQVLPDEVISGGKSRIEYGIFAAD